MSVDDRILEKSVSGGGVIESTEQEIKQSHWYSVISRANKSIDVRLHEDDAAKMLLSFFAKAVDDGYKSKQPFSICDLAKMIAQCAKTLSCYCDLASHRSFALRRVGEEVWREAARHLEGVLETVSKGNGPTRSGVDLHETPSSIRRACMFVLGELDDQK